MAKRIDWAYVQGCLAQGMSINAVATKIHLDRSTLHRKAKKLRWATPLWVKRSLESLMALQAAEGVPVWEDGGALGASVREALRRAKLKMDLIPDAIVDGLLSGDSMAFTFRTNREIQAREANRPGTPERQAAEYKTQTTILAHPLPQICACDQSRPLKAPITQPSKPASIASNAEESENAMIAKPGLGGALSSGAGALPSESSPLAEVDIYSSDRADLLVEVRKMLKHIKAADLPLRDVGYLRNLVALHKELMGRESGTDTKSGTQVYINIGGLSDLAKRTR